MKKQLLKIIFITTILAFESKWLFSSSSMSRSRENDYSGKTFLTLETDYSSGSFLNGSLFNTNSIKMHNKDHNSSIELTAFGSKNTNKSNAAAYFLPYGYSSLEFNGKPELTAFMTVLNNDYYATTTQLQYNNANPFTILLNYGGNNFNISNLDAFNGTAFPVDLNTNNTIYGDGSTISSLFTTGAANNTFVDYNPGADNNPLFIGLLNAFSQFVKPASYFFDSNTNKSIVRPWNFGITFAALFEPEGSNTNLSTNVVGAGLITSPEFKSTISPELYHTSFGIGGKWRQYFSNDKKSCWLELSSSLQYVKNEIKLNENVLKNKTPLNSTNFNITANPTGIPLASLGATPINANVLTMPISPTSPTVAVVSSVGISYLNDDGITGTYFPVDGSVTNYSAKINNVTEAFAQSSKGIPNSKIWQYGMIDGSRSITRLADIEAKLGFQLINEENYNTSSYLGLIIPTGNKVTAKYVFEPIVGNNRHLD